jgi:hypothetical protein
VDYTYFGLNQETVPLAPAESMQFGRALNRVLQRIVTDDPRHGPVYLCKVDIADGFYRLHLATRNIPALGVAFPPAPDGTPLVAFPLTCPMGWVQSPPWFSTATETGADLANATLATAYNPAPHRLDTAALTAPAKVNPNSDPAAPTPATMQAAVPALPTPDFNLFPPSARRKPVQYVNIYVNDYLGLAQGGPQRQNRVRRILFESIDLVFRPLSPTDPSTRQEPISVKKLLKGDGAWRTRKTILGWILDSVRHTIELPPRRLQRLVDILAELPHSKTRITTKRWQQLLGELRSMVLAVPGLRGLFSLLQETLRHEERQRICITSHMHAFLDNLRWIVQDLHARPTRLWELVDTPVAAIGASDAAAAGMGGVLFAHDHPTGTLHPILWRAPFPPAISHDVVSSTNPNGLVTNSDL